MVVPVQEAIGRYTLWDEIAAGGMARVHIGRLQGPVGFSRTVAIKRLHPQFSTDPEFVSMLLDEARLVARIRHPNVVPTLDVVKTEKELFLVMDYVHGESLDFLLRQSRVRGEPLEPRYAVPIVSGVLHGLHAAHEATGANGQQLGIVHRDVSPHNVLVGTDGVTRVFDFGIAKACGRLQTTREGQVKGKLAYMAPEQLAGRQVGPRADVYATAVVLWEALAGQRLFDAEYEASLLAQVIEGVRQPPSKHNPDIPTSLDEIVMRGLEKQPGKRFSSAREMAAELEKSLVGASTTEIGEWVEEIAGERLAERAQRINQIEGQSDARRTAPSARLGPYELVAELHKGCGGPLWVSRASSGPSANQTVLIRRLELPEDLVGERAEAVVKRLGDAGREATTLRHDCLARVVDVVEADEEVGIVSEYVEGETLRSLLWLAGITQARIGAAVALRIATDVLEGLSYLHEQGDRDGAAVGLTADEILVGTDGRTRVLEPGLAGVLATLEPWKRHPKRARYGAPEQLRDGAPTNRRSDVFSLGVLLWEMIQNRALFPGSSFVEIVRKVRRGPIGRVGGEGASVAIADILSRALEREEQARYGSAAEMLAAVEAVGAKTASTDQVAEVVGSLAADSLLVQRRRVAAAAGPGDGAPQQVQLVVSEAAGGPSAGVDGADAASDSGTQKLYGETIARELAEPGVQPSKSAVNRFLEAIDGSPPASQPPADSDSAPTLVVGDRASARPSAPPAGAGSLKSTEPGIQPPAVEPPPPPARPLAAVVSTPLPPVPGESPPSAPLSAPVSAPMAPPAPLSGEFGVPSVPSSVAPGSFAELDAPISSAPLRNRSRTMVVAVLVTMGAFVVAFLAISALIDEPADSGESAAAAGEDTVRGSMSSPTATVIPAASASSTSSAPPDGGAAEPAHSVAPHHHTPPGGGTVHRPTKYYPQGP